MEYDEATLDYIHGLESQIFELEHVIEKKDFEIARLSRENSVYAEQLDQYLGVH
jgi:hypothetical protein